MTLQRIKKRENLPSTREQEIVRQGSLPPIREVAWQALSSQRLEMTSGRGHRFRAENGRWNRIISVSCFKSLQSNHG